LDIFLLGDPDRTNRATVDARGEYANKKSPVKTRITHLSGVLELIGIQEHGSTRAGWSEI
jgi:hypothetical protein